MNTDSAPISRHRFMGRLSAPFLALLLALVGCQQPLPKAKTASAAPPAACTSQNLNPEALFTEARRGVAVVMHDGGSGSAFVVRHQNGSTLLVTNAHVVEGTDSVKLRWENGSEDNASVVSRGGGQTPLSDLALLEVKAIRGKVLDLKTASPKVGAEVVAIGAPQGLEFSLTRGVVSSLRENGAILQIDAPINPGNSGGPLIDRTGCVVGIVTFKLMDSEGLNFAVATSKITHFLADPVALSRQPAVNTPPSQTAKANCWFQMSAGAEELKGFSCRINARVNSNGHTVYDVEEPGGLTRTVVLWEGEKAEVIVGGQAHQGEWRRDDAGDILVTVNNGVFGFSLPE